MSGQPAFRLQFYGSYTQLYAWIRRSAGSSDGQLHYHGFQSLKHVSSRSKGAFMDTFALHTSSRDVEASLRFLHFLHFASWILRFSWRFMFSLLFALRFHLLSFFFLDLFLPPSIKTSISVYLPLSPSLFYSSPLPLLFSLFLSFSLSLLLRLRGLLLLPPPLLLLSLLSLFSSTSQRLPLRLLFVSLQTLLLA